MNGNYSLEIASASPTGAWQTWSGVNNTDYLLVAKHAAGTALLPETPPVVRIAGDVLTPHPLINTADANAIRAASTFGWGNPAYFDIPKWVFSGLTAATPLTDIQLSCANVTRDILGLCAGDVNGTAVPGPGVKTLNATSLQLVNQGVLPVTQELVFPIRADQAMELGAITLMLDFNSALIEITGVEMPDNAGVEPWFQVQSSKFKVQGSTNTGTEQLNIEPSTLNLLQIGWMSLNPVNVVAGQPILLIHARLVNAPSSPIPHPSSLIRFTLHEDQLNELADGEGNVIDNGVLTMPDACLNSEIAKWRNGENGVISVYPNPAKDVLNVVCLLEEQAPVQMELLNLQGISILKIPLTMTREGCHREKLDISGILPGVYMLKVRCGDQVEIRKVIVDR